MKMQVMRMAGSDIPSELDLECRYNVGDRIRLVYDYNNYRKQDVAEFKVVKIYVNGLISPAEVWLWLEPLDELYARRNGSNNFEAKYETVLKREVTTI